MSGARPGEGAAGIEAEASRPATTGTAVWIDGTSAMVARWTGRAIVERVLDEVPSHHRSTGRVRHDPAVRHGGGGIVADQLDRDRLRHRGAHLRHVASLVPDSGPVLVLGPGSAREELARELTNADRRHRRARPVRCEPSGRVTERELVARLRESVGEAPGRRVVGRV